MDVDEFRLKYTKKSKVTFDPMEDPDFYFQALDTLMLLFDVVVPWKTFQPSDLNRYYSLDRFIDAVDEDIVMPYFALDEFTEEAYAESRARRKKDIRDEVDFSVRIASSNKYVDARVRCDAQESATVGELIEKDSQDEELSRIIGRMYASSDISKDSLLNSRSAKYIMDYLNTDLVHSRRLDSALFSSPWEAQIWSYKFGRLQKDLAKAIQTDANLEPLIAFLEKVTLRAPKNLGIDEIVSFRKDKASARFREWFNQVSKKAQLEPLLRLSIDDTLVSDFNELCKSYETDRSRAKVILTSIVTTIATAAYPPLAPAAALTTQLSSDDLYNRFYRKYGDKNWLLHVLDLKRN